jgi:biotin carboxyl carrier protein
MKLKAQLSGREDEVSLELDDAVASAEVDGRHYEIKFREQAADSSGSEYVLLHRTNVYKCRVERKRGSIRSTNSLEVVLRGQPYDVTIIDPKRLRSGHTSTGQHHGEVEIVSPMPGKIVRVLVEAGAQVEPGAGIIVVEAMKMQNEMKSPKAGVVISINTEAGATVNAGDVLAVIE